MNGVYETTTTSGTGDVTLSAVTGRPRVSDMLGVGALCNYELHNGDNREWGIGKSGASNTLIRLRPTKTIVSGTVTKVSPSPISLSGSTDVHITPISGAHPVSMRRIATNSGRKGAYSPHILENPSGTLTVTAERLYIFPFEHNEDMPISGAFIDMNTSGAASTKARICIYRLDENAAPTDILAESGDIDTSVAATVLTATWTALDLPPDWYAIGLLCNGTPTFAAFPSGVKTKQSPFGVDGSAGSCLPIVGFYKTVSGGWTSMPASPTGLTNWYYNTAAMPAIALKYA